MTGLQYLFKKENEQDVRNLISYPNNKRLENSLGLKHRSTKIIFTERKHAYVLDGFVIYHTD